MSKKINLLYCLISITFGAIMAIHAEYGNVAMWGVIAAYNGLTYRYAR
jgi:hypothetical protein